MAIRSYSLQTRLLLVIALVLLTGFAATVALLDNIFRQTSQTATQELLNVQILALIGAAEPDTAGRFSLPEQLPESRFASLGSGLFAEIVDDTGNAMWRSPSATGAEFSSGARIAPGQWLFERRQLPDGSEIFLAGFGFAWELTSDDTRGYQIFVAEDMAAYYRQLEVFRRQLHGSFAALTAALLIAVWFAVRSGLKPLKRIAREIHEVETGHRENLGETYPAELAGVAHGLNALVQSERQRMGRFRTTMDDLAHSLKTPLAVLGSESESANPQRNVIAEQINRMQSVVNYQLRRAVAKGPRTMMVPQSTLAPICAELAGGLQKIYRDRQVEYKLNVPEDLQCLVEQGDLYELLGNVMENAWKYCNGKVCCQAERIAATKSTPATVLFRVEDDGAGIPDDKVADVLNRGSRLEARGDVPGQGIGLAVVTEILELYSGTIDIKRSPLGGAAFELRLPV